MQLPCRYHGKEMSALGRGPEKANPIPEKNSREQKKRFRKMNKRKTETGKHISMRKLYRFSEMFAQHKKSDPEVRAGMGWINEFLLFVQKHRNSKDI